MAHPINIDIDEQCIRDRFANMLIDMAEELSPGITTDAPLLSKRVEGGCDIGSVCCPSITGPMIASGRPK